MIAETYFALLCRAFPPSRDSSFLYFCPMDIAHLTLSTQSSLAQLRLEGWIHGAGRWERDLSGPVFYVRGPSVRGGHVLEVGRRKVISVRWGGLHE